MDEVQQVVGNKLVQHEAVQRNLHLGKLRELWMRAGANGLHWQPGSVEAVEQRWQFLVRAGQRLTASAVSTHTTAWTCWEKWVRQQRPGDLETALFCPDPVLVAGFLDFETKRGPTLGRSRLQSFGWLRKRLGLNLPAGDVLLADFVNYPANYHAKQAKVMSPTMFVNLVGMIHKQGAGKSHEALLVLFFALACVRQKHLAISTLTDYTEQFVMGYCPEGKMRRGGSRPPFAWAVPRPSFLPDAFTFLADLAARMEYPSFVVPALAKIRMKPIKKWQEQPMTHNMAMRLIRHVFLNIGMPRANVEELTFNTCRRFLPTLGNVLGLSRHDTQAIGNWVEDQQRIDSKVPVLQCCPCLCTTADNEQCPADL